MRVEITPKLTQFTRRGGPEMVNLFIVRPRGTLPIMRTNRSIPNVVVIPELAYPNVNKAVKWLCDAFGFRKHLLIANHRAQLSIGESGAVVVMDGPSGTAADSGSTMFESIMQMLGLTAQSFYASLRIIHMGSANTRPKTVQVMSGLSPRPSQMLTQRNGAAHWSVIETGI
jgi:hypothetical protein